MATSGDLVALVERLAQEGDDLAVTADLTVTVDGLQLSVRTVDDRLHVELPSAGAGLRLARRGRGQLRALARVLDAAGQTAEVRAGDRVLAVVGADAVPGRLATLLSLGAVEPRLRALAAALVASR